MEKYFVPYDIARELKEIGFDENCNAVFIQGKFQPIMKQTCNSQCVNHLSEDCITAPLYDQVIDWFIEKHEVFINVNTCRHSGQSNCYQPYFNENCLVELWVMYDDRYEALNAGILKAIELVKQRQ